MSMNTSAHFTNTKYEVEADAFESTVGSVGISVGSLGVGRVTIFVDDIDTAESLLLTLLDNVRGLRES